MMRLGVDIGGTTIHLGLVEGGRVVRILTSPSFSSEFSLEQTYGYLCDLISNIITPEVESIGVGVPSVVDSEKGIVYDAANIPSWKEVHLKEVLEARFGITVNVNNDSNCYALGAYGKMEQEPQVLVAITLGTGVGMGVIVDGKIFNGSNTGVGEISCGEYLDGIYEDYTSSKFFSSKGLDSKKIYDSACAGVKESIDLYKEYAHHLGKLISLAMYAYDPDVVVLGGGLANSFDLFKDSLMDAIKDTFVYRKPLESLTILAMPSDEIPVLGASLL